MARLRGGYFLASVSVVACSVFPDHAELLASGAGGSNDAGAASGGAPSSSAAGEGSVDSGGIAEGGSPPGSAAGAGAVAGAPDVDEGGAAGAGGAAGDCRATRDVTVAVDFDTWLNSADPRVSYANDSLLSVAPAPDERRAVLQLVLPAMSGGGALARASLRLQLEANADATQSARLLGLHRLTREVGADTTWRDYSSKKWDVPGGDFGPELARVQLPASTTQGTLQLDVTELVRSSAGTAPVTLSVVILEIEPAPQAPAQLAFSSIEGDASKAPSLLLSYCEP